MEALAIEHLHHLHQTIHLVPSIPELKNLDQTLCSTNKSLGGVARLV